MKRSIREKLLAQRNGIRPEQKEKKDSAIRERLFGITEVAGARHILFYASFRSEVDTSGCIEEALGLGKTVSLPRVDRKSSRLCLYRIQSLRDLSPGYMGIPEPRPAAENETLLSDIQVVIVPGAAFDLMGNRLGYGAGYYDRLLSGEGSSCIRVGLAYEGQVAESVPSEDHDVPMRFIVTEDRVIRCGSRGH